MIWLRGARRIFDPGSGIDVAGDLWIRDGVVGGVGEPPPGERDGAEVVDVTGLLLTPMFVDLHVHFREPGGEEAETLATGAAAALAGGYAVVFAMPNTRPVCDRPETLRATLEGARGLPCEIVPVSALSRGLEGRELVDLEGMWAAGARAFSDDGRWLGDDELARTAFSWAARRGALVMQHCEDFGLTGPGVLHDAPSVRAAGLPGIPRRSEDVAVERDISLALAYGTRFHVCHLSTAGAVARVTAAQDAGLPVSAEATPHHLLLTCEDALAGGVDFKMKPPLRERADVDAVLEGLVTGVIDAVATDHAPHSDASKGCGWHAAPFGAIGLETAFPALYTGLVRPGRLPLDRLVTALTAGPAAIARIQAPSLAPGAPARVNAIDVESPRRADRAALRSRSHNTPFHGRDLVGWPVLAVRGERVHRHALPPRPEGA